VDGESDVRFRILGQLEVRLGDSTVLTGRSRQERTLAALLLDANRIVPVGRLVDVVWDEEPPRTARKLIQNSVSALRQQLSGSAEVVSSSAGYRLRVPDGQLDLTVFEEATAQAQRSAAVGDAASAVEDLRAALALWRGPALAGLTGRVIEARAASLDEAKIAAIEECLAQELTLGRHHKVVGELSATVADHPLRERLVGLLLLALYRSGRRADALRAFQQLRARLAEELGLDPGAELCRLHEAVLRADPILDPVPPAARSTPTAAPVPAQLPADVPDFTGRDEHLKQLHKLATDPGTVNTVVVTAISGTAGVGKTALAVHWAHQIRDRFGDGQLYVNLRGFDPSGSVMEPAEAIRGLLDALAVPPERIPGSLAAQIGLYRSLLTGRRMLVMLDNARDAEQVRPLLPGAPGCLVVVTSRVQLPGLVTAGARPLTLDLLTPAEARDLLARRLGADRLADEPDAVDEIITRCARLPLALTVVAARAAYSPSFRLATIAAELRHTLGGLDAFDSGDAATDIRAVFSWSYHALSPDAARLFRLLGVHPGPDISTPAAASLAGTPPEQARSLLAELTRAHLITEHRPGRYAFHDLMRAYATEQTHTQDPAEQRRAATVRLLDHYVHTAHTADRLLHPVRDPITPAPPRPGVSPETLAGHRQAVAWFTTEHPVLLVAVDHAANTGFDTHTWQLAWTLANFLDRRGYWADQAATAQAALAAARRLADPTAQGYAHRYLARAYTQLGRHDDAHTHLQHSLDLSAQAGDQIRQAHTHRHLALVWARQGRHSEALHHARQALDLYRAVGHQQGQAEALNAVGWYHAQLGDHQQALAHCQQALTLYQELGDRNGEAGTWDSLGYAHHHLGHHQQAIAYYQRALDLRRDLGVRYFEAETLTHLGDTHHAAGNPVAARVAWHQALTILADLDHPDADQVRTKLAGLNINPGGHN
jgi:DNA-binding SARP family transcriptional activator/Tfp pilus assembly protein PilF